MSRRSRASRSSRRLLLAAVGFVFVSSVLSAQPVAAHTSTKADGNDSPGKLDLRSVSVSHTATGVVHTVTTYNSWTSRSLGADSFFIIQIDKNNDRHYERCAFIFYTNRLRGSLTNCGAQFIRFLPVSKVSGTTAKITIPKSQTGRLYWWAGASLWDGPAPCGSGCVDFAPNNFPDILHDLRAPVVLLGSTDPIYVWDVSTTPDFDFPFSVTDAHSGVAAWSIQRRLFGETTWTPVVSGTGGGVQSEVISGTEGEAYYRVFATDKQGNTKVSPERIVFTPTDQDSLGTAATIVGGHSTLVDVSAFGGDLEQLDDGAVFTYHFTDACNIFYLIGPGDGTWTVSVTMDGSPVFPIIDSTTIPDGPRQVLWDNYSACFPHDYGFTVSGTGFAIDAVFGNPP
jgi:hypothetical protein